MVPWQTCWIFFLFADQLGLAFYSRQYKDKKVLFTSIEVINENQTRKSSVGSVAACHTSQKCYYYQDKQPCPKNNSPDTMEAQITSRHQTIISKNTPAKSTS